MSLHHCIIPGKGTRFCAGDVLTGGPQELEGSKVKLLEGSTVKLLVPESWVLYHTRKECQLSSEPSINGACKLALEKDGPN